MIYDRIDLVAIGTWAKNFRPRGLTLTFGTNLKGGDKYTSLTDVVLPYGTLVGGDQLSVSNFGPGGSDSGTGGVYFSSVANVLVPYGITFLEDLVIGGKPYPTGLFTVDYDYAFLMNTIQLVDVNKKALLSVHDIESGELMTFARPTADIRRLVMYKDGVGMDAEAFACYSIVFKSVVTLAEVNAFNALHPNDTNPIIIDDGAMGTPNILVSA